LCLVGTPKIGWCRHQVLVHGDRNKLNRRTVICALICWIWKRAARRATSLEVTVADYANLVKMVCSPYVGRLVDIWDVSVGT
ncbi:hypothetical protein VU08_04470, partial [Desulfobulbus sp. F5]|nr:hypothetical protein [Desulfobulbus sp. F5]